MTTSATPSADEMARTAALEAQIEDLKDQLFEVQAIAASAKIEHEQEISRMQQQVNQQLHAFKHKQEEFGTASPAATAITNVTGITTTTTGTAPRRTRADPSALAKISPLSHQHSHLNPAIPYLSYDRKLLVQDGSIPKVCLSDKDDTTATTTTADIVETWFHRHILPVSWAQAISIFRQQPFSMHDTIRQYYYAVSKKEALSSVRRVQSPALRKSTIRISGTNLSPTTEERSNENPTSRQKQQTFLLSCENMQTSFSMQAWLDDLHETAVTISPNMDNSVHALRILLFLQDCPPFFLNTFCQFTDAFFSNLSVSAGRRLFPSDTSGVGATSKSPASSSKQNTTFGDPSGLQDWILHAIPLIPVCVGRLQASEDKHDTADTFLTFLAILLDLIDTEGVSHNIHFVAVHVLTKLLSFRLAANHQDQLPWTCLCMPNQYSNRTTWKRSPSAVGSICHLFYRSVLSSYNNNEDNDEKEDLQKRVVLLPLLSEIIYFMDHFRFSTVATFRTHVQEFRIFYQAAGEIFLQENAEDPEIVGACQLLELQLEEIRREEREMGQQELAIEK